MSRWLCLPLARAILSVGVPHTALSRFETSTRFGGLPEREVASRLHHWETLPEVGAWPQADRERVIALRPDMILTSATGTLDAHKAEMFDLEPEALINFDTRTLTDLDRQIVTI